jgi:hypothetical protein
VVDRDAPLPPTTARPPPPAEEGSHFHRSNGAYHSERRCPRSLGPPPCMRMRLRHMRFEGSEESRSGFSFRLAPCSSEFVGQIARRQAQFGFRRGSWMGPEPSFASACAKGGSLQESSRGRGIGGILVRSVNQLSSCCLWRTLPGYKRLLVSRKWVYNERRLGDRGPRVAVHQKTLRPHR